MSPSESVFFYTFHKCASSLFARFVLPNVRGLRHENHAARIFRGELTDPGEIRFEQHGFVYGPIRLSTHSGGRERQLLTDGCSTEAFVRTRRCVLLVRDPRDILVSAYHSFGFTHPWSPDPGIRAQQEQRRAVISAQSVDEYALESAPELAGRYLQAQRLIRAGGRFTTLRYEDMVDSWSTFERGLREQLDFAPEVLAEIHARSRPREGEDAAAHKRSGKVGSHRAKLAPATVAAIDDIMHAALDAFGYARGGCD
jgi:hypothetical protein